MHKQWIKKEDISIFGVENMFLHNITANVCAYVDIIVDKLCLSIYYKQKFRITQMLSTTGCEKVK